MCKAVEIYADSRKLEGRMEGILEGRIEGKLEGKLEGKVEGKFEGKVEGRIEGRIEGKLEDIKNMLREGISLETALRITGIDKDTYGKYAAKERLQ